MTQLNSQFDEDPAGYDALRQSWMSTRRETLFIDFLRDVHPERRVLEIGAGTGSLLLALAQARPDLEFVGIEPLANYVDFARDRASAHGVNNVRFVTGTADDQAGLGVTEVDRIVSVDVLHHVNHLETAVANVTSACLPGGRWCVIEPNRWNPYMLAFQGLTRGERNFRPDEFTALASAAGWRRTSREYRFLIPARVKQPKQWLKRVERRAESFPLAGGAVVITLERSVPEVEDPPDAFI